MPREKLEKFTAFKTITGMKGENYLKGLGKGSIYTVVFHLI